MRIDDSKISNRTHTLLHAFLLFPLFPLPLPLHRLRLRLRPNFQSDLTAIAIPVLHRQGEDLVPSVLVFRFASLCGDISST